jgi:RND family efflux transporter MFP subunit
MVKKLLLPTTITLVGVIAISLLVIAKPQPVPGPIPEEPALVKVSVVPAKQESLRLAVTTQGTVMPKHEIDLVAQVSGQVVHVEPAFVSGGFFQPSQALIHVDDRDYRAALLRAKAQVAEAEQRLAEERGLSYQAKREWRDLGNQSANDLFLRKPQLAAAEANLASAQGALASAELDLERTRISVPFAGRIKTKHADLGQYVTVGTPVATVYDSTVVEVRLPLTEAQAGLVDLPLTAGSTSQLEEPVAVTIRGSVAGQLHEWQGVLTRTDAFVDTDSRLYYAVVEVADPFATHGPGSASRAPLLPGLFVEAEIAGKRLDKVLKLPRSALFERDKLFTLDGDNKVGVQQVSVLRKSETEVWIRAAIDDDTLISLEKQSLTPTGTVVNPVMKAEAVEPAVFTSAALTSTGPAPAAAKLKD